MASGGWATPDYSNTRETYSRVSAFEMDDGWGSSSGGLRQNRFNYSGVHANKPRWQRFALIGLGVMVIGYTLFGGSDDGNHSADYSIHDYADYGNSNNNNDYAGNSGGSSDYAGLRGNNNNNNKDTNIYGGIGPSPTPNHETPSHPGINQDKKDVPPHQGAFPQHDKDIWGPGPPRPGSDNHHHEGHDSYFHNPGEHHKGERPFKGDKPLWHHNGDGSGKPGHPGFDGPHPNDPYSNFNGKEDKPPAKVPLPSLNELENLESEYKESHPDKPPTEAEIQECVQDPPEEVTQVCEGHEDPVCLRKGCQHGLHHAAQHFIGSRDCIADPPKEILKTCSVAEFSPKASQHQDCIKEGCRLGPEAAQLYIASNFIHPNTTFTVDDPSLDICLHKASSEVTKICATAVHAENCLREGCKGPDAAKLYMEQEGGDHLTTAAEEAEGLGGEDANNNNATDTTITETTSTEEVFDPNTGENENITITRASPDSAEDEDEDKETGEELGEEKEEEKITATNETSTSDEETTTTSTSVEEEEKSETASEEETAATSTSTEDENEDESVAQNSTTTHYNPLDEFALPPKDGTFTPPAAADGDVDTTAEEKDSNEEEEEDPTEAATESGDAEQEGSQDEDEGASDMTLIGDIAAPNDGSEEDTEAGESEDAQEQSADPEEGVVPPIEDLLLMPPNLPSGDAMEQPAVPQSSEGDEEGKSGKEETSAEEEEQEEEGEGEDTEDEDNESKEEEQEEEGAGEDTEDENDESENEENSEDQDEEMLEGEMESELDVLNGEQEELDEDEDDEDWEAMEEGMEEDYEEEMEKIDELEAEMEKGIKQEEEQESDSEEGESEDLLIEEEEEQGEEEYESIEDASLPVDEEEEWEEEWEEVLEEEGDWGDDEPTSDSADVEGGDLYDEGNEGGW